MEEAKPPSPDIILRCDNDFLRDQQQHAWDSEEEEENSTGEKKMPDVQRDDLASRRARLNRPPARRAHHFLPGTCSRRDQERWEGIRRASQQAVLEKMEKMEQEKKRCGGRDEIKWGPHGLSWMNCLLTWRGFLNACDQCAVRSIRGCAGQGVCVWGRARMCVWVCCLMMLCGPAVNLFLRYCLIFHMLPCVFMSSCKYITEIHMLCLGVQ